MARFVSGSVVVIPFPFTDLTSSKLRPAPVPASLTRGCGKPCFGCPKRPALLENVVNLPGIPQAGPFRALYRGERSFRALPKGWRGWGRLGSPWGKGWRGRGGLFSGLPMCLQCRERLFRGLSKG